MNVKKINNNNHNGIVTKYNKIIVAFFPHNTSLIHKTKKSRVDRVRFITHDLYFMNLVKLFMNHFLAENIFHKSQDYCLRTFTLAHFLAENIFHKSQDYCFRTLTLAPN